VVVGHSISGGLVGTYAATYPVRGAVIVDSLPDLRPFAAFARRLEPGLRGPAFDRAFAPFQESMGFDRIPEPLRSQILARQDVRQELVLSYWDELLNIQSTAHAQPASTRRPEGVLPRARGTRAHPLARA
jgi:pimeloyl-ACP methyl ester carboxylesterase